MLKVEEVVVVCILVLNLRCEFVFVSSRESICRTWKRWQYIRSEREREKKAKRKEKQITMRKRDVVLTTRDRRNGINECSTSCLANKKKWEVSKRNERKGKAKVKERRTIHRSDRCLLFFPSKTNLSHLMSGQVMNGSMKVGEWKFN